MGSNPVCRFCNMPLQHTFIDLGMSPLCESYVAADNLDKMEPFYPLHVYVCDNCFLVQLLEYVSPEDIFSEYAYFSSYSDSWLNHAKFRKDGLGPTHTLSAIGRQAGCTSPVDVQLVVVQK